MRELSELRSAPKINTGYKFKNKRVSILERSPTTKKFEELRSKYQKKDELEECTFKPNILNKSPSKHRSVTDLMEWENNRKKRLAEKSHEVDPHQQYSFTPKLNKKSELLIGDRQEKASERLFQRSVTRRSEPRNPDLENSFMPKLNKRSMRIMQRKSVVAKDNLLKSAITAEGKALFDVTSSFIQATEIPSQTYKKHKANKRARRDIKPPEFSDMFVYNQIGEDEGIEIDFDFDSKENFKEGEDNQENKIRYKSGISSLSSLFYKDYVPVKSLYQPPRFGQSNIMYFSK